MSARKRILGRASQQVNQHCHLFSASISCASKCLPVPGLAAARKAPTTLPSRSISGIRPAFASATRPRLRNLVDNRILAVYLGRTTACPEVQFMPTQRGKLSVLLHNIWSNTEPITQWLTVIGLFAAGILTLHHFWYVDRPSEEVRADVEAQLTTNGIRNGAGCTVTLDVTVSNPGTSPFDVTRVHIRVWETQPPKLGSNWKGFVDTNKLQQDKPVDERSFDKANPAPLLGHYSPKASTHQTFSWMVAKPMPLLYLFRVDIENEGRPLSNGGQWMEGVCP